MQCGWTLPRTEFQLEVETANEDWIGQYWPKEELELRADGDANLTVEDLSTFKVPRCKACGMDAVKPRVVFFGESMQSSVRQASLDRVHSAGRLLIMGTSTTVFSVFRLCLLAEQLNKAIAIVNVGPTRADPLAQLKLEGQCGPVLSAIYSALD